MLPMWTIYESPLDYPGKFVVRKWETLPIPRATDEVTKHDTIEEARASIPPGLHKMARFQGDEPCIVEVWF